MTGRFRAKAQSDGKREMIDERYTAVWVLRDGRSQPVAEQGNLKKLPALSAPRFPLFGSDQMIWPGVIEPAIAAIKGALFISEADKRDIFYNNAARFFRLCPEEMARHRSM